MMYLLRFALLVTATSASAQDWLQQMHHPNANVLNVVRSYTNYYNSHPFEKNSQTQDFKRWLRSAYLTCQPDGSPYPSSSRPTLAKRNNGDALNSQLTWNAVGPFTWDKTSAGIAHAPGQAHCYVVREHPSDSNVVVAGMATAGVWISRNAGASWTNTTQLMPVREVRAVAFHPTLPAIVAFGAATGISVSRDNGTTWNPTAFAHDPFSDVVVHDIFIFGTGGNEILAATNRGLLRSSNGGASFQTVVEAEALELEQHPTQNTTWYAVVRNGESCRLLRSTDNGATFSQIGSGLPTPNTLAQEHSRRWEIAVTPAAPNALYLLAAGVMNGGEGLVGVYVSTDQGATFELRCCGDAPGGPAAPSNPNLMHWDPDGQKDGGQYYYDLALAVSPSDANRIYVGGINVWVSEDGGRSFVCNAKWTWEPQFIPRYVHADVHEITTSANRVWVASDGGAFFSANNLMNTEDRTTGIVGTEFWGWGQGFDDCNVMLGGTYHNGVLLKDGDVYHGWHHLYGGDNGAGLVNFSNSRVVYADVYLNDVWQKVLLSGSRTVAPQKEALNVQPTSPIVTHPHAAHQMWAGTSAGVQRTTDHGRTWHVMATFGDTTIRRIVLPASAPDVVLALGKASFWDAFVLKRSDDGGNTFVSLPIPAQLLAGNAWRVTDVATSMDAQTIVVAVGGRQTSRKVLRSDDGGATWIDWSDGLGVPSAISLLASREQQPRFFVGTEDGVFERDLASSAWIRLGSGLPMANCNVLSICERNNLMRTATNRGVWEVPLQRSAAPIAIPSVAESVLLCAADTAHFFDFSAVDRASVSRRWEFVGGEPAISAEQSPRVTYAAPGTYPVRLTVTDVHGTDTRAVDTMITVLSACSPSANAGFALVVESPEQAAVAPSANLSVRNLTITAWIRRQGAQADFSGIVFTRSPGTATGISINGDGRLRYHAGDQGWWVVPTDSVPDSTWTHVGLIVRNDTATLVMNGKAERFVVRHPDVIAAADVYIGKDPTGSRTFRGEIDEVRLYRRALSVDEVRAAMYLTNPDTAGLASHYQFEHGNVLSADNVGRRHAALPAGAKLVASGAPVGYGRSSVVRNAKGTTPFLPTGVTLNVPEHQGSLLVTQYQRAMSTPPTTSERSVDGGEIIVVPFEPDTIERPQQLDVGMLHVGSGEEQRPTNVRLYARPIIGAAPWGNPVGQAFAVRQADSTARFTGGFFFTAACRLLVTSTEPAEAVSVHTKTNTSVHVHVSEGGLLLVTWPYGSEAHVDVVDLRGKTVASTYGAGRATASIAPYHAGTYGVVVRGRDWEHARLIQLDASGRMAGIKPMGEVR